MSISWKRSSRKTDLIALDDGDTIISPGSWEAALRAAGAAIYGVDEVMQGQANNAFCCIRPPGHHAEIAKAMGFCLFNNAAVAAFHAQAVHGAERVAVVDFDLHHGNGTQAIFWHHPSMFYAIDPPDAAFSGHGRHNRARRDREHRERAACAPATEAPSFARLSSRLFLPTFAQARSRSFDYFGGL